MLDRIERVTRSKEVDWDTDRSFKRKKGYEDRKEKKQQFSQVLDREIDKNTRPANEAGPNAPRAYRLELARPTHSLYYTQQASIPDRLVNLWNARNLNA